MYTALSRDSEPRIADFMTSHPITVGPQGSIAEAAELLRRCRIRHLPVVDAMHAVLGVLSLRDVLPARAEALVGSLMTRPALTVAPEGAVADSCERMLRERVSSLLVVDDAQLRGIFTATDGLRFAEALLQNQPRPVPVEQLMTHHPLATIAPTAPLTEAWALMRSARVRHLPVMAGETLAGIISDRNILAGGYALIDDDAVHPALLVADAMTAAVLTVAPEAHAVDAARLLLRRRFGALPVMASRRLIGMLTVSDFLYWILSRP